MRLLAAACALGALLALAGGCASNIHVNEAGFRAKAEAAKPLSVPLRAPTASEDYQLGVRDVVLVRIFELEAPGVLSTFEVEVDAHGAVPIPYLGAVPAEGMTAAAFRQSVEKRLGEKYLVDPQVIVSIKDYKSRQIGVMGAVEKPGIFHLNRNRVSIVEALSLAGGLNDRAGIKAFVLRPKTSRTSKSVGVKVGAGGPGGRGAVAEVERIEVDLVALLTQGDLAADVPIEHGTVIQVPPADEFFVGGYVQKAGAYPYRRPTTVLQAIAIAGGLDPRRASPSAVRIKRPAPESAGPAAREEIIEVDVGAIAQGDSPDVPIFPGDSIECDRTLPWAIWTEVTDGLRGVFGFGFSLGSL